MKRHTQNWIKITILLAISLHVNTVYGVNYYVSNQGNDGASGTSASTAWSSLSKINNIQALLNPGDSILLKRGSVFYESLLITKSGNSKKNIYIGAYGVGPNPIIDGGKVLTNWINKGGNLWETVCNECLSKVNALAYNNKLAPIGRYPDNYSLTPDSLLGKYDILDADLASIPNFTGGEIIIRSGQWVVDRWPLDFKIGNFVQLKSNPSINLKIKNSTYYYLQNHVSFLTKDYEWAYDSVSKKMTIYLSSNPSSQEIKLSLIDEVLKLKNVSFVKVENIKIQMSNLISLNSTGGNISFNNISIENGGKAGFALAGDSNHFSNSSVRAIQNNVGSFSGNYNTVSNSIFKNNCLEEGMGTSGGSSHNGITVSGDNHTFIKNRIDSCGYTGLNFGSANNLLIKNNYFSYVCLVKNDGGAIYTWSDGTKTSTNRRITGNIVMYSGGAFNLADLNKYVPSEGIYIDDRSTGVLIDSNTVGFCKNIGIYVHNSKNISVLNNLSFGNKLQFALRHDSITLNDPPRNINVSNNIFATKYLKQTCFEVNTIDNNYKSLGTFSNNIYSTPFDNDNFVFNNTENLNQWIVKSAQDINSLTVPVHFSLFRTDVVDSTNLVCESTFTTSKGCYGCHSPDNNCNTTWDNTNKLTGKSLKVNFNSPTNNIGVGFISNVFPVDAGNSYRINMSLIGSKADASLKYIPRRGSGSFSTIGATFRINVGNVIKEQETIINVTETLNDARIDIEMLQKDAPIWIDNIKIVKVKAVPTNPDDSLLFEINTSNIPRVVPLSSCYVNSNNKKFQNSIAILPYSSVLLYKLKSCIQLPLHNDDLDLTGKADEIIYPNPSDNEFHFKGQDRNIRISIYTLTGIEIANYTNASSFGSELEPGIYLAKVKSETEIKNFKIVKK